MPLDTECELLCHLCRETLPEPERHFHLQRVAPEDQETEQSHYVKDVLMQEIKIILKMGASILGLEDKTRMDLFPINMNALINLLCGILFCLLHQ